MDTIRMEADAKHFATLLEIDDFDMLITAAIGSRHTLHGDISALYKKNREVYYKYFKESPYFQDQRLSSLSVQNYKAIQQFIGIYLSEKNAQSNQVTMKLIRKGYRFVYQFVNNHFKVDFYKLRDEYMNYVKKNAFEKNVHLGHLFGVALYLTIKMNKPVIFDSFDIKLIKESIQQALIPIEISPELFPEVDDFLERYKDTGILKKNFSLPLKDLVVSFNRIHGESSSNEDEDNFLKGLNKVGLILQFCNINPLDIQNITTMEQGKMKEIVALAMSAIEMFQLSEDVDSLLGTYLLIFALAKDYNLTKYSLMVTTEEENYLQLKEIKKEFEKKLRKLEREEEEKNLKLKQLQEFNDGLHEKVRELEKQLLQKDKFIQKQQGEIQEIKDDYQSLQRKYNLLTEEPEGELSQEELIQFLSSKNCVIIGGLKSWQEQLKNALPQSKIVQPEDLNIDLNFLQNADIVMFNEAVNNHAMYQKVKKALDKTKIPLCYSGNNTNIYFSLKKMYEELLKVTDPTQD